MTIETSHLDGVAVVSLSRGVTNAINLELVRELHAALKEIRRAPEARALVLTSANDKFFSIGFDIPVLLGLTVEDFRIFYQAYNRLCVELFSLEKPTVAAITGHAIAGGCILALCCDHRYIAGGRKLMGVNEVLLGVPVPYPGDCVLRYLVGARAARDLTEDGRFLEPADHLAVGLVDRVLPPEDVRSEANKRAAFLGDMPDGALSRIKRNRIETVQAQIMRHLEEKEEYFIECWYSGAARQRLEEAKKKF